MGDIWDAIDAQIDNMSLKVDSMIPPAKVKYSTSTIVVYHTRGGTYIDTSILSNDTVKKIKKYYTISNKNIMGYFEHTMVWKHSHNKLYIPRFGALLLAKKFKNINFVNKITCNNPLPDMTYLGKLNPGNQEVIYNEIMTEKFSVKNMNNGTAGLILDLQAGKGKTFLAMYIISQLKCKTLIVVHNENMLTQWYNHLSEKFPNTKVGRYYGKKKDPGDFTIGIINSLVKDVIKINDNYITPREFYDNFDLVVLDEVHIFSSPENRKIYNVAQCPYMIGLSATPDEHEKKWDKINNWSVGPILRAIDIQGFLSNEVEFKGIVFKIGYYGPSEYTEHITNEKLDVVSVPSMIGQLVDDPYRLQMIINLVLRQHKKGLNILVFADRRSYLSKILDGLEKVKLDSIILDNDTDVKQSIDAFKIMGGSSEQEFALAKEKGNIILSTYQYMSTGISIQRLNSIVLCTPRKSKSKQIINRIFRLGSDENIVREIIDIVDMRITLKNQWYTRKVYYDSQNFTITDEKIKWETFE